MCRNCVKSEFPQRDRLCSESGAYLVNFAGCSVCKDQNRAPDSLKAKAKAVVKEEDDGLTKELLTFEHTCVACGHVVSKHCHEFWLEDGYQEYRMECSLCGLGEDSVSILPKDPKKVSQIPL
jgi:rRNA maturation protein Nop10